MQPWFALQTKPRGERKVEYSLSQKGYECFVPLYRQKRKWSDRTVEIDMPLFPQYVFCRLNSSVLGKAVSTSGVIRIVGFGGKPADIAVEEVDALQLLARSSLLREPWKHLYEGTRVLVESGPLAGVEGVICGDDNKRRLIISVTLLQRSVAIQLPEDTVITVVSGLNGNRIKPAGESEIAAKLLRKAGR
jgi:transcription antitermination factor NusG